MPLTHNITSGTEQNVEWTGHSYGTTTAKIVDGGLVEFTVQDVNGGQVVFTTDMNLLLLIRDIITDLNLIMTS